MWRHFQRKKLKHNFHHFKYSGHPTKQSFIHFQPMKTKILLFIILFSVSTLQGFSQLTIWQQGLGNVSTSCGTTNAGRNVSSFGNANTVQAFSTTWAGTPISYVQIDRGWESGAGTKGWKITVNTSYFQNLSVSFYPMSYNRNGQDFGPRDWKMQYSLDNSSWTDVGSGYQVQDLWSTGPFTRTLPAACDNKSAVYLRWIMTSNTATDAGAIRGTGTGPASAIGNIKVTGIAIPTAPTNISLSANTAYATGSIDRLVGSLTSVDPNECDSPSYSLVAGSGDTDNSNYRISGNNLLVKVATLSGTTNSVRMNVNDGTYNYSKSFIINIEKYCSLNGDDNQYNWITNVKLNEIDKTSGMDEEGYGNYCGLTANVNTGSTYELSVTHENLFDTYAYFIKAWIDWNQNGSFEDSECYIISAGDYGSNTFRKNITVPSDAVVGTTRMRLAARSSDQENTLVPTYYPPSCGIFDYGEAEDYTIRVQGVSTAITSVAYNALTGALTVTGTGFTALTGSSNDIDVSKLTITGEGGTTYTLTDSADAEITSSTSFTVTLSATDRAAINQIINKNGTNSTSGTAYNLAAAEDWAAGAEAALNVADLTGNGITASNVALPAITGATYNAATGTLQVTGTGFLYLYGSTNDIIVTKLTITGEGGASYTLTSTNVDITSGTSFIVTLNSADRAAINQIVNKNGTVSTSGTVYNLAAAEDWAAGADAALTVADLTGNVITANNVAIPAITSAAYIASTGSLQVSGTGFLSLNGPANDITVSKLTITGEGGATYTLTSQNVDITSGSSFSVTLNSTDKAAINQIVNKNGTVSTSGTVYNLAAAEDWAAGADAGVTVADLTGNGITASNVALPTISGATYNAGTGTLAVSGNGFLLFNGSANDIAVSKLTLTGEGGATYTLTSPNVDITSGTSFTVTLNSTDKAAVNQIANKNGQSSTSATTYNLAAAEDWASGADAAVVLADLTGNAIDVSNVAVPSITSATYDANSGALIVSGSGFLSLSGLKNDIDVSAFTFTGEGGSTYTLTDSPDVDIASGTSFVIILSPTDKAAINQIANKNGTSSRSATVTAGSAPADQSSAAARL
jgi:predicted heme/steroid binding protein